MRKIILYSCLVFFCYQSFFGQTKSSGGADSTRFWEVVKTVGKTLYFDNGRSLDTKLYNLTYLDQLPSSSGPYVIVSGRSCNNCGENDGIYVLSTARRTDGVNSECPRYSYPGRELHYLTHELLFESRVFVGRCWDDSQSIVWIQRELGEDGIFKTSCFIVKLVGDKLIEIRLDNPVGEILNRITRCKEIPGKEYMSEP